MTMHIVEGLAHITFSSLFWFYGTTTLLFCTFSRDNNHGNTVFTDCSAAPKWPNQVMQL